MDCDLLFGLPLMNLFNCKLEFQNNLSNINNNKELNNNLKEEINLNEEKNLKEKKKIKYKILTLNYGLLKNYFKENKDQEFYKWNKLYNETTIEKIKKDCVHQLNNNVNEINLLIKELYNGKGALKPYPKGCPPPIAFDPIAPPLKEDAKLMFINQHSLSLDAAKARDIFVEQRLKYGIDEKSYAHSQVPVFTIPKPNTDERRIIHDDTYNSNFNMKKLGIQMPRPMEVSLFLRDATILTSIDLASFFTSIRIKENTRDFWTYDGGIHGKVRSNRLVQGNSESPAIAQALITYVLQSIP